MKLTTFVSLLTSFDSGALLVWVPERYVCIFRNRGSKLNLLLGLVYLLLPISVVFVAEHCLVLCENASAAPAAR